MAYGVMTHRTRVEIEWVFNDGDENYWEPHEVIPELLKYAKATILEEFMIYEDEWMEFVGGMSMTHDKVKWLELTYRPMQGATLRLWKRNCQKCKKPCGLASTYCDGTGKATENCQECGKTRGESLHRAGCSWNR